jgi:hypothetical protein
VNTYELTLWAAVAILMAWCCLLEVAITSAVDKVNHFFWEKEKPWNDLVEKFREHKLYLECAVEGQSRVEKYARELEQRNRQLREELAKLRAYRNHLNRQQKKEILP